MFVLDSKEFVSNFYAGSPSERLGHTASKYENFMYLFGGWDGSKTLNDLWEFDLISEKFF